MGKKLNNNNNNRSKTLPSSPTHSLSSSSSSSSSEFEFRNSISPRKSSAALCPADELFYKGQLLPLHLSPRISMVRTLLLASSSTSSSSDTTTSASRDSSSSNDSTSSSLTADLSLLAAGDPCCDSSRPSSVTDDDGSNINKNFSSNNNNNNNNNCQDYYLKPCLNNKNNINSSNIKKSSSSSSSSKYFSLSRFSNVFKKDPPSTKTTTTMMTTTNNEGPSVKKVSSSAKEVIRKYMKKVKPLYEKLSSKQQPSPIPDRRREPLPPEKTAILLEARETPEGSAGGGSGLTHSFSGNLKVPRMIRKSCVASCPSSMRSSPSHSGVLTRAGLPMRAGLASYGSGSYSSETSTMEELQNAIQGAIAHCKNSMVQSSSSSFNDNLGIVGNGKGKALMI